jgi:mitotic spindle assembly checkpoint protein MAD1
MLLFLDPHLSSAKRQQRTQAFTSNMAHASLERKLVAAQTTKMELETKLREKDMLIEKLERDRRWFSDREQEEREEKEREWTEHEEQTVGILFFAT